MDRKVPSKQTTMFLTCCALLSASCIPSLAQGSQDGSQGGPQGGQGGPPQRRMGGPHGGQSGPDGPQGGPPSGMRPRGTGFGRKLQEERAAIRQGVQNGTISPEKAQQLRQNVAGIAQQAAAARAQNGGQLNPNQIKQFKNELRQTKEMVQSTAGSGTSVVESPREAPLTGPRWTPGPDGAQNPVALKHQMKTEERRELRQERQATEQVQEQQQMDYQKQMTQKLGQQRKTILDDKKQVQKERNQYGAN